MGDGILQPLCFRLKEFHLRQQLRQQRNGLLPLLACVDHVDVVQRGLQLLQLGVHRRDLLVPLGCQVPALGLHGGRTTLQLRLPFRHAGIEIILPADHAFLVAEDLLCGQPLVPGQRDKAKVHVRCLFIHVYHGRNNIFLAYTLLQKVKGPPEVLRHFHFVSLGKLRADRYQCVHELHAVLPYPAACHLDAVPDLLFVAPSGRHQMEVLRRAAEVNVRVAGVAVLCPLVVGTQCLGRAALVLCKS